MSNYQIGFQPMAQALLAKKFKIELLRVIVSVVRQLLALDLEAQEKLLTDLELVIETGDFSKLPPTISLGL